MPWIELALLLVFLTTAIVSIGEKGWKRRVLVACSLLAFAVGAYRAFDSYHPPPEQLVSEIDAAIEEKDWSRLSEALRNASGVSEAADAYHFGSGFLFSQVSSSTNPTSHFNRISPTSWRFRPGQRLLVDYSVDRFASDQGLLRGRLGDVQDILEVSGHGTSGLASYVRMVRVDQEAMRRKELAVACAEMAQIHSNLIDPATFGFQVNVTATSSQDARPVQLDMNDLSQATAALFLCNYFLMVASSREGEETTRREATRRLEALAAAHDIWFLEHGFGRQRTMLKEMQESFPRLAGRPQLWGPLTEDRKPKR